MGGVLVKLRQQWGMGRRWALGKGRGGEMTMRERLGNNRTRGRNSWGGKRLVLVAGRTRETGGCWGSVGWGEMKGWRGM